MTVIAASPTLGSTLHLRVLDSVFFQASNQLLRRVCFQTPVLSTSQMKSTGVSSISLFLP